MSEGGAGEGRGSRGDVAERAGNADGGSVGEIRSASERRGWKMSAQTDARPGSLSVRAFLELLGRS